MIKFGIIGLGGRGGNAIREIINDKEKRGDIIAICDLNPAMLERYDRYVKENGGHGCEKYTDYKEMLAKSDIDAVVIGTPDQFHHEMALEAFKYNKHVLLEKPIGRNLDEMIDIVNAAYKARKEHNKIIEIGYVLRYAPFYGKIKEIIESGKIGRINFVQMEENFYGGPSVFYRNWWRFRKNIGGIMIQKICHDLDLAYWFFGKPKKVAAIVSTMEFKPGNWDSDAEFCHECKNRCPYFIKRDEERGIIDHCVYNRDKTGADIGDNAQVIVQFESGLNLSLSMNFLCPKAREGRYIHISGSKAGLTGHLEENLIRIDPRHDTSKAQSYYIKTAENPTKGHGGGDALQIREFLKALEAGKEARAGLESAYWSSILVMGAQISADKGIMVDIEELTRKYPFPNE